MEKNLSARRRPRAQWLVWPWGQLALVLLGGTLLAGCATTRSPELDSKHWEARAMDRATQRWTFVNNKQYDKAYEFFTDASKKGYSVLDFATQVRQLRSTDAKVKSASCLADVCEVVTDVTLTISIPRVGNKQQVLPMPEQWRIENGEIRLIRRN
jgi:hypothetical protein